MVGLWIVLSAKVWSNILLSFDFEITYYYYYYELNLLAEIVSILDGLVTMCLRLNDAFVIGRRFGLLSRLLDVRSGDYDRSGDFELFGL